MRERPIHFNGEMVRAILEGRKTQTRRMVKKFDIYPYAIGDRLWVRETSIITPKHPLNIPDDFSIKDADGDPRWVQYLADEPDISGALECCLKITPSIHMPRWASRIALEITDIRFETLNEITNLDCFAEGLPSDTTKGNRTWFADLWESIYGPASWAENPWVRVIEFRKLEEGES